MFEAFKERMALRAALKAARGRAPRPYTERLRERRVLVVLPQAEADLRPAWRFVLGLDLPRGLVRPVALEGTLPYVPDAYAGSVLLIGAADRDWRGLPKRSLVAGLWARGPDVAIDLSHPFRSAAALLVGGSPAALRVGLFSQEAEPFYDLLLAEAGGLDEAAPALGHYLRVMDPPVLPFREPVAPGALR